MVFTKICQKSIREIDLLARIGGDEFALLLPQTNSTQAYEVVERVRWALAGMPLDLGGSGLNDSQWWGYHPERTNHKHSIPLLGNADQALYQAEKENGPATVSLFGMHLAKAHPRCT